MKILPHQDKLISRIRTQVPITVGVYIFKNESNQIIYIGKSVKLRNRMLSYFQNNSDRFETRINQMIHNIHDYTYQTTESELLAFLLEDSLIKKHKPFYNIKQQEFNEYQYILLTNDPFPSIKILDHFARTNNGSLFGPFKDHYFTEILLTIIHQNIHLRSCKESEPTNRCLSFELGNCPGPCRNKITVQEYSKISDRAISFLCGNTEEIVQVLSKEMKKNAKNLDFEKAKIKKELIIFCKNFGRRQRFFNFFKTRKLVIFEKNSDIVTYIFNRGFLTSHSLKLNHSADDRFLLDRANIIYKWIHAKKNLCKYHFEESL